MKRIPAKFLPGWASPVRLILALPLLCCLLWSCAARDEAPIDDSPDVPKGTTVNVAHGSSVYVEVEGAYPQRHEDFASMLTAFLQSERGLVPADRPDDADIILLVDVGNVSSKGTRTVGPGAVTTFGTTATGALLGMALGGVAGRKGALVGAGAGAALGLGVALADDRGRQQIWGMEASYGIGKRGRYPSDDAMREAAVTAAVAANLDKEDSLPSLEDSFCRYMLSVLRN